MKSLLTICQLARTGSLLAAVMLVSGCATYVQAPFDSFVCYQSTFNRCMDVAQAGQLKVLEVGNAVRTRGTFLRILNTGYLIKDPDAGKLLATKDGRYQCEYGAIPYAQNLQPDQEAPAVFVSPVLIRQIGEQQIRLTRSRTACERLVQTYEYQQEVLKRQDRLSTIQKLIALFNDEIERDRYSKEGMGARAPTADEVQQFGITMPSIREALRVGRDSAITLGEELRGLYKTQIVEVDYKKQFEDANLTIDLQLRELGRNLFILDRSVVQDVEGQYTPINYATGSWVKQGTIVLTSPMPSRR